MPQGVVIGANAFPSSKALSFCHYLADGDAVAQAYLDDNCTMEELTAEEKATFKADFPGQKRALYKVKLPSAAANYQYLGYWNPSPGMVIIFK